MRRGINIRKRKREMLKELNSKSFKLILISLVIIITCIILCTFFIRNMFIKKNFEKDNLEFYSLNENIPFSIKKVILFSSVTNNAESVNQSMLSLDISQYSDIGIYLDNLDKEHTSIKSLYIDNIKISNPELGTPCLYKKLVSDLGKCSFDENNIIQDNFYFDIIDSNNKINKSNYELSSDGSTPISLGFYNKNVKENFLIEADKVTYDGTILKNAMIYSHSLRCNISFCINIITPSDEHYICNINFDIPLEDDTGTIYDNGYVTKEISSNEISKFIRIK